MFDGQTSMLLLVTATNKCMAQQGDVIEQQSTDAMSDCSQNTRLRLFCSTSSSQHFE